MSVSFSRCLAAILAMGATGCVGPWNDLPPDDPVQIRASVAVFLRQDGQATATLSRPIDLGAEKGMQVAWIDRSNSLFGIEESSVACLDSLSYRTSTSLQRVWAPNSDWSYTTSSSSSIASCGPGRTWRFRGHLRWNASSPFSMAQPVWVTDSVDAWGEISTAPVFQRGNLAGPLELRWRTLAQADSTTRAQWSRWPQVLGNLVEQWKSLQTARGRDARVLVLDTTTSPAAWRWFDLDTALLRKSLASFSGMIATRTVFPAADTIWLPTDHGSWIQAQATGTAVEDLYAAVQLRGQNESSLASVSPSYWFSWATWLQFMNSSHWRSDTAQFWFGVPSNSGNPERLELAVAGTCAGQREFLHQGGSNRQKLPHGNVAPLDGFVCEVNTDTIDFPLGQ